MKANNPDESAHVQFRAEVKRMSDAEAAKIIQSVYGGFKVRKWEPLKKLKQIAKAREQVDEIRNRVESLESSSVLNKDDRQGLLIGEMIMSLLLKLDTIQGLHSSVKDARKSFVRELVTLQEKLNSLTSKWAEEKAKELAAAECADFPRVDACRNVSIENESEEASAVCISSFEDTTEKGNNIKESDQEYITRVVDEESNVKNEEPLNVDQALDGKIENETTEVTCDIECHTAPRIQDGDLSSYHEDHTDMSSVPEQKSKADECVEANDQTREGKLGVVEVNDVVLVNNDSKEDKLGSLPNKMTDHLDAVSEIEKEIGYGENLRCTEKNEEIDLVEELPVGLIDEEPAIAEFEKCETHETGKSNTLSSTEGHRAGCEADEQLLEATSGICLEAQKENEFNKNPELEVEVDVEQTQEMADEKFESLLKPEVVPTTVGEKNNDKVHEEEDDTGAIPADHMASSESESGSVATQEEEVLFEEKKEVQQPVEIEEKEEIKLENKIEVQEQECMSNEDKTTNIPHETLEIEENKKLREIREKLMEAGKDQLTVISNLSGRVKELEEKLSRKKKVKQTKV